MSCRLKLGWHVWPLFKKKIMCHYAKHNKTSGCGRIKQVVIRKNIAQECKIKKREIRSENEKKCCIEKYLNYSKNLCLHFLLSTYVKNASSDAWNPYMFTTTLAFQLQYISGCGVCVCIFYILWWILLKARKKSYRNTHKSLLLLLYSFSFYSIQYCIDMPAQASANRLCEANINISLKKPTNSQGSVWKQLLKQMINLSNDKWRGFMFIIIHV